MENVSQKPPLNLLYYLAGAAITKYQSLGGLNKRHLFSHSLEDGSPRSECQLGGVLVNTLFLACRWLTSLCFLTLAREGEGKRERKG